MKKKLACILVTLLLAAVVPLVVTPAAAISEVYEKKIPFAGEDNELTKDELVSAILPYMLGEGDFTLDNVGDAAWVYAYWSGNPKTIVDMMERTVTIYRPMERLVTTWRGQLEMPRSLKLEVDRMVGVESLVSSTGRFGVSYVEFFPEYQDKPTVGVVWTPDAEAILGLHPDAVFLIALSGMGGPTVDVAADILESAGITVFRVYGGVYGERVVEEAEKLGYILDKEAEAEEFIDWYEGVMNSIKEKVEDIPEEDKPKVYFESGWGQYSTSGERMAHIAKTGGKDIFEESEYGPISAEAVADRNPDVIIVGLSSSNGGGYHLNAGDTAKLEEIRGGMISRSELRNVTAIKEGRVYVLSEYILGGGPASGLRSFVQDAYMAKWFHSKLHPELFDDFDPKAIHQEYLTRFQGVDIDLDKKGVFVYPEEPI